MIGYGFDLNGELSSLKDSIVGVFRQHKMLPEDKIQKYSVMWNKELINIINNVFSSPNFQND